MVSRAVDGQHLRSDEHAEHGEKLRAAPAAELPAEDADEEDLRCAGERGKHADSGEGLAEDHRRETRLKGDEGRLIDVSPGESASADKVVELVAVKAVAQVRLPEVGGDEEDELNGSEPAGETDGLFQVVTLQGGGHGLSVRRGIRRWHLKP